MTNFDFLTNRPLYFIICFDQTCRDIYFNQTMPSLCSAPYILIQVSKSSLSLAPYILDQASESSLCSAPYILVQVSESSLCSAPYILVQVSESSLCSTPYILVQEFSTFLEAGTLCSAPSISVQGFITMFEASPSMFLHSPCVTVNPSHLTRVTDYDQVHQSAK